MSLFTRINPRNSPRGDGPANGYKRHREHKSKQGHGHRRRNNHSLEPTQGQLMNAYQQYSDRYNTNNDIIGLSRFEGEIDNDEEEGFDGSSPFNGGYGSRVNGRASLDNSEPYSPVFSAFSGFINPINGTKKNTKKINKGSPRFSVDHDGLYGYQELVGPQKKDYTFHSGSEDVENTRNYPNLKKAVILTGSGGPGSCSSSYSQYSAEISKSARKGLPVASSKGCDLGHDMLEKKLVALSKALDKEASGFSVTLKDYVSSVTKQIELYQNDAAQLLSRFVIPMLQQIKDSTPNYVEMFDEACMLICQLMQDMPSNKSLYYCIENEALDHLLTACKQITAFSEIAFQTCLFIISESFSVTNLIKKIVSTREGDMTFNDSLKESFRLMRAQFLKELLIPFLKSTRPTSGGGIVSNQRELSFDVLPDDIRASMQKKCMDEVRASLEYEPSYEVRRLYMELFTCLPLDKPLDPRLFNCGHGPYRALMRGRLKMHRLKLRLFAHEHGVTDSSL